MKQNIILISTILLFLVTAGAFAFFKKGQPDYDPFVSYKVDIKRQEVKLYWKDNKNENFRSIKNLKLWLHKNKRKLVFAMNAGMYKQDNSPQGLYIENQKNVVTAGYINRYRKFLSKA